MLDARPRARYEATSSEWDRLRELLEARGAVLGTGEAPLDHELALHGCTVHHLVPRSLGGDDYEFNLIVLTGSGTTAMHGLVTIGDKRACARLRDLLEDEFPEKIAYVVGRKSYEFLDRYYPQRAE